MKEFETWSVVVVYLVGHASPQKARNAKEPTHSHSIAVAAASLPLAWPHVANLGSPWRLRAFLGVCVFPPEDKPMAAKCLFLPWMFLRASLQCVNQTESLLTISSGNGHGLNGPARLSAVGILNEKQIYLAYTSTVPPVAIGSSPLMNVMLAQPYRQSGNNFFPQIERSRNLPVPTCKLLYFPLASDFRLCNLPAVLRCAFGCRVPVPFKPLLGRRPKQSLYYWLSGLIRGLEVGRLDDATDAEVIAVGDAAEGSVGRAGHAFSI